MKLFNQYFSESLKSKEETIPWEFRLYVKDSAAALYPKLKDLRNVSFYTHAVSEAKARNNLVQQLSLETDIDKWKISELLKNEKIRFMLLHPIL